MKVIHEHESDVFEEALNEALPEGFELVAFQFFDGPEHYHYVAILKEGEDEELEEIEEPQE